MPRLTVLDQPATAELDLATIMGALADVHRLAIVRALAEDGERVCGTFDLGISKATRSHHLGSCARPASPTHASDGTRRIVSLRRDDLEARFPGLLAALLDAAAR